MKLEYKSNDIVVMKGKNMNGLIVDKRLECSSVMVTFKVSQYIKLVTEAYKLRGGIQGQREPLRQKTAITIRKRMIKDIVGGTILPPVVIGIIVSKDEYSKIDQYEDVFEYIQKTDDKKINIIDGMQRTTAIIEAIGENNEVLENDIRVEFWISSEVNSMLYRMLVLNTGQVPWNMRRQVELVFDSVIQKIEQQLTNIEIIRIDDKQRRSKSGQYNAKDLIEMFMAFGARTWKVDTRERVTDEFSRGDLVQSSEEANLVDMFCAILEKMYELDCQMDCLLSDDSLDSNYKFRKGRDVFSSGPAKIGFAAACGEYIFGRPGEQRNDEMVNTKVDELKGAFDKVLDNIINSGDVYGMVDLETLSEVMERKSSKVGDFEREKFYSAFKVILETKGNIDTFTVCWRA